MFSFNEWVLYSFLSIWVASCIFWPFLNFVFEGVRRPTWSDFIGLGLSSLFIMVLIEMYEPNSIIPMVKAFYGVG